MLTDFFLKIGKPLYYKKRLLYLLSLFGAFFLVIILILYFRYNSILLLDKDIQHLQQKIALTKEKRILRHRFLNKHEHADAIFLKNLEKLTLCHNESKKLTSLLKHPAFYNDKNLVKLRLIIDKNIIRFQENLIESSSLIKETEFKIKKPFYANEEDLKNIINLIESPGKKSLKSPQLILKKFSLKKEALPIGELFLVDMHIIQREFLKKS